MEIATKLISHEEIAPNVYSLKTDSCELRVMFLTDDIVRIRASFDGDFTEASYSLALTAWDDQLDDIVGKYRKRTTLSSFFVDETVDGLIINGAKLSVKVDSQPFKLQIFDESHQLLHADIIDLAYQKDSNQRIIHTSEIFEGDHFYGFGEKTGEINKAYQTMTMSPKDTMGYNPKTSDSLYKHIPFYVKCNKYSKIACGYFYHTTFECDFDMGREHSNYWKKHSRFRADGGDIDLFFIAGPTIKEVVQRYTDLTGKSCLLPKYALGYLGSSMYYSELEADCDDEIIGFIDTSIQEYIPIDGFQLSSGYTSLDNKRYVFEWNKERFKNPTEFFAEMERRGVSTSPNVKPGLLLSHPMLEELKEEDVFVKSSKENEDAIGRWWGGEGLFVDFTNPHARKVWKKYLTENLLTYGVYSVWNDNCEYDSIVDKDAKVDFEGKGGTIGQLKSVMANIMCQITIDALEEEHPEKRPFVVCRSGHAGIQRYAQSWAGDNFTSWDSLKYNIATILGMAVSGVTNFGCDIGGFYGEAPEEELFVRWVQNGIFQPRFSIHSTNTDNTVTEPWMYDGSKELIQQAIQFRYQMAPLYYSLMRRASKTGLPIIQPMFMAFQNDENCYENGIDFVVDDSLLVANVVEKGQKIREIYLPKGRTYYDFYTRERYVGGQVIKVAVEIDTIPLFIISGSIVPLANNKIKNLHQDSVTELKLLVVADEDCSFTLYEDDGISNNYQQGNFLEEKISVKSGEIVSLRVERDGNYPTTVEKIFVDMIHTEGSPYWVSLNDQRIPHIQHRNTFEKAELGWYYSQTLRSVLIKYPNPTENYELKVSFENFDMLGM